MRKLSILLSILMVLTFTFVSFGCDQAKTIIDRAEGVVENAEDLIDKAEDIKDKAEDIVSSITPDSDTKDSSSTG